MLSPFLSSATAELHGIWPVNELFSSLVSTVKMRTTNPKSEQGCELIEYQLF